MNKTLSPGKCKTTTSKVNMILIAKLRAAPQNVAGSVATKDTWILHIVMP